MIGEITMGFVTKTTDNETIKALYEDVGNVYGALKRTCQNCGDVCMVSKDAKSYERYCRYCGGKFDDWSDEE